MVNMCSMSKFLIHGYPYNQHFAVISSMYNVQFIQLSENIRTLRQLSPVMFIHFLFTALQTLTILLVYYNVMRVNMYDATIICLYSSTVSFLIIQILIIT